MLVFEKGYFKKLLKIPGVFDLGESIIQVAGLKRAFLQIFTFLFFIIN